MAYTVVRKELKVVYRDNRGETRTKSYEIGSGNVLTDDDAQRLNTISKCAIRSYRESIKQVDVAITPDADSEKDDTARLYFLMPDDTKYHFDIVDPLDELFVGSTGSAANTIIPYEDMATGSAAAIALGEIIDNILGGDILISDGETPIEYIGGERI